MRRSALVIFVCAGVVAGWRVAEACGDKLLLVGRSVKFQRAYAAVHPGHVLIYARPSTSTKAAIREPQFQKQLRQAGHAVSVIEDAALLEQALRTTPVDIVLVDLMEVPKLHSLASASPAHPTVMPVLFPSNSPEVKKLQQQYACKLKNGDSPLKYLESIEAAMKDRVSARRGGKI
jgi:hypothetical protein